MNLDRPIRVAWPASLLALGSSLIALLAQTPPPNPFQAPLYWSVYEHHIIKEQAGLPNNYIPESELVSNINFVDFNLKNSGYTMICMDGWGDAAKRSPNGYQASHSRHWEHDFAWWSSYLQQRGMTLGIYGNPLWIHVGSGDTTTRIAGTNVLVSSLINTSENASWFTWCQVDRPGAEQYVKGYIKYYADMGVKYLRIDFLSWYESGWDRNFGQVGPTNRPHAHYVTALKWMREAADANGIFLSLVMPNLFTTNLYDGGPVSEAAVERQYGHMVRINEDAGSGAWWKWSDKDRGIRYPTWSQYANAMDGLTYWSYISGRSNLILDPDFIRINTFANSDEKKSVISACLLAGAPVTPSDQYSTIGGDTWVYVNPELLALRKDGFVGAPVSHDPTLVGSQIWRGQTTNGDWIVGLFNRESTSQTRSINFASLGLGSANVRDLWGHTNLGTMTSFSASVRPHACRILRVSTNVLTGPVPMHVQSLLTGTQGSPYGGSLGTAAVAIKDHAGNPVADATVRVRFSGSYDEEVSAITAANGIAMIVTTGTASGNIRVTADVTQATHATAVYAADQNVISGSGERMYVAGTFSNWRLKEHPMRFVNGVWQAIGLHLDAGTNYQMKFANTGDWSGQDWGSATGLSGIMSLTTGGGPNATFSPLTNGLYTMTFNPVTLAYAIQLQWQEDDIGAPGVAGSASCRSNDNGSSAFTVLGSGWDIQSTADAFHFVYQTASGDCDMRARVASLQNTDPWAKSGLMIREGTAAGARYAAVLITPNNGVSLQWRTAAGGNTGTTIASGIAAPGWLRISRSANVFRAFYSADGRTWTQIGGNQTISMLTTGLAGVAVCSHNAGTLTTSTIDNVFIGPLNTPPILAPIASRTTMAGRTLVLTNSASDTNLPAQALLFSLLNPPTGAQINPTNGVLSWRPAIAQSPSSLTLTVVVADNGVPPMSATQTLNVTVTRPALPAIDSPSLTNGFEFSVAGEEGPDYVIQSSTNLDTWSTIATLNAPALPFRWKDTNSAAAPSQFYRVLLAP